jgi:hypothetical protein
MRGKNVILVTAFFIVVILVSGTSNGQVEIGDHSPTLVYNPLTHKYLTVFERWGSWLESLQGKSIDPWGKAGNSEVPFPWCQGNHCKPSMAYDAVNNRFLTVWADGSQYLYLFGLLLDANGNPYPWGESGFLVSTAPGSQTNPIVTFDSANARFLVTWIDDRNVDGLAIYGQLVSAEGELEGTEFLIQSGLGMGYHAKPYYSVAYDHVNQGFLVVWSLEESISGQFINADGVLLGEKFIIVEVPGEQYFYPIGQTSLAYDGLNQRYLVVWDQMLGSALGQLVNADGTLYGTSFYLPSYGGAPSVAFDNVNQRFLVAWTGYDTSGQFINSNGSFQGDVIPIVGERSAQDGSPNPLAIAFNPECGNFLVASVTKKYTEISDFYVFRNNLYFTVVGDPCPSATLTIKMKGYGGKRKHISGVDMNCIKNICSGQHWPGSEIDIGAWVDGKEVAVTWTGCDAIDGYSSCHITMDSDKNLTVKFAKVPKKSR